MDLVILFGNQGLSAQSEINDFLAGRTKTCISDGTGKSKGLRFQFKYPNVWTEEEPERPNVAKRLNYRDGEIQTMVLVYKLDIVPSEAEKDILLSDEGIRYLISNDGIRPNNIKINTKQKIDGEDAAAVSYELEGQRLDKIFTTKSFCYIIIYQDYEIALQFGVAGTEIDKVRSTYLQYEELFKLIANHFVIISKWNK